jgi:hypothetical protein
VAEPPVALLLRVLLGQSEQEVGQLGIVGRGLLDEAPVLRDLLAADQLDLSLDVHELVGGDLGDELALGVLLLQQSARPLGLLDLDVHPRARALVLGRRLRGGREGERRGSQCGERCGDKSCCRHVDESLAMRAIAIARSSPKTQEGRLLVENEERPPGRNQLANSAVMFAVGEANAPAVLGEVLLF